MSVREKALQLKQDIDGAYAAGHDAGYEEGKAEGGDYSYYDEFWDSFQRNGNRTQYDYAFARFSTGAFRPKYDMHIQRDCNYMFDHFGDPDGWQRDTEIDLVDVLEKLGVVLDFSTLTTTNHVSSVFSYAQIKRLGILDFSNISTTLSMCFQSYTLTTIDKLIVSENTKFSSTFTASSHLENVTFEGVIAHNGLNVSPTKLNHDSLMSIINILQDKSGDTSGTTWKVTFGSTLKAKLTEEELLIAEQKGWTIA